MKPLSSQYTESQIRELFALYGMDKWTDRNKALAELDWILMQCNLMEINPFNGVFYYTAGYTKKTGEVVPGSWTLNKNGYIALADRSPQFQGFTATEYQYGAVFTKAPQKGKLPDGIRIGIYIRGYREARYFYREIDTAKFPKNHKGETKENWVKYPVEMSEANLMMKAIKSTLPRFLPKRYREDVLNDAPAGIPIVPQVQVTGRSDEIPWEADEEVQFTDAQQAILDSLEGCDLIPKQAFEEMKARAMNLLCQSQFAKLAEFLQKAQARMQELIDQHNNPPAEVPAHEPVPNSIVERIALWKDLKGLDFVSEADRNNKNAYVEWLKVVSALINIFPPADALMHYYNLYPACYDLGKMDERWHTVLKTKEKESDKWSGRMADINTIITLAQNKLGFKLDWSPTLGEMDAIREIRKNSPDLNNYPDEPDYPNVPDEPDYPNVPDEPLTGDVIKTIQDIKDDLFACKTEAQIEAIWNKLTPELRKNKDVTNYRAHCRQQLLIKAKEKEKQPA